MTAIVLSRLVELETVIGKGLRTFVEVGAALLEIRDSRLYREQGHKTFEDYTQRRWGFSRQRAAQLIEASEVVGVLSASNVLDIPNARQAAELAPLASDPEALTEAWIEANERTNGKPTAEVLHEIVTGQSRIAPLMTSVSDEWYTPPDVVERVISALGSIDLDPAAELAKGIPAEQHLTKDDDALEYGWNGRIFLNPPFSRVDAFVAKLASEAEFGNIREAIVLVPARTETKWWRVIPAQVVAFFNGRLRFSGAGPATFPSAALYIGPDASSFEAAFADVALVYRRVS